MTIPYLCLSEPKRYWNVTLLVGDRNRYGDSIFLDDSLTRRRHKIKLLERICDSSPFKTIIYPNKRSQIQFISHGIARTKSYSKDEYQKHNISAVIET